jgi:hypothetical protein
LKHRRCLRSRKKVYPLTDTRCASALIQLPGRQIENVAKSLPVGAGHRTCPDSFFLALPVKLVSIFLFDNAFLAQNNAVIEDGAS